MDSVTSVKAAGLRYINDQVAGIRRIGSGKTFRYISPNGRVIRDAETLQRIRSLAIPPAWTHVWISPIPEGYLQSVGRDARGRKQYRYHSRWREVRDSTKYNRMIAFGGSRVRRETAWKYGSRLSQVLRASGCDRLLYAEVTRRKIESPSSVDLFETRRVRRVAAFARNGNNA